MAESKARADRGSHWWHVAKLKGSSKIECFLLMVRLNEKTGLFQSPVDRAVTVTPARPSFSVLICSCLSEIKCMYVCTYV